MATEAEPSGQLMAQNTEIKCEPEPSAGPDITTDESPAKKPVILKNCELCNVVLTSQSIVNAHMGSKKHKKKVQAADSMKSFAVGQKTAAVANSPLFRCDICNVTLNSLQQKEFHLAGMKHTYKVKKNAEANGMLQGTETTSILYSPIKMKEATTSISSTPQAAAEAGGTTTETDTSMPVQEADLRCTVCNITVNSVQQLTQHLGSKKHELKENSLKRSTPYYRPRRGVPGRGAVGGPGPHGGRGRGLWGGRSKPGEVNNPKSNFQSARFTTNFQTPGGNQSLKRERSPRDFGNGNNDDFSNQPYHQGRKIPRGSQSAPFNSQDFIDHGSFRSGNKFSGGNNSFGGGNSSLSGGNNSFGGGNNSFGGGNNSFGGDNNSFGGGNNSFGGGNNSLGRGNNSLGRGNNSLGRGNNSLGRGNNSLGRGRNSFGRGNTSFGRGNTSFGRGNTSFGGASNSFGGITSFGGDSNSFGGNTSFGGPSKSFGRGSNSFGGGNNSFGEANNSFGGGNTSFGGGNKSFGDGSSSFGAGKGSFGSGNNFGDSNNSFQAGFGRGNVGGGPQRGNSLKRGRGFGHRGSFGNYAGEGGH